MQRRDFIKGAALAAATLPAVATAAPSRGSKVRLKLATSWPANLPILHSGVDYFVKRVAEMSGGSLEIKVYPAGALVPALGVFDAVSAGQIDAFHSATYYWSGKNSAFSVFAGTPFGMNSIEMVAWMRFGGGLELWREVAAKYNLYPLLGGNTCMQMGGWFKKPVDSLADLKGLKMRIPGLGAQILSKLGVNSVMMPGGEIYLALERNVIDAADWVSPALDLNLGLYKVAKYYYTGWYEPASTAEFVFNAKVWNDLSPEHRAIVEVASQDTNTRMMAEAQALNAPALEKLLKQGVQIKTFSKEILDACKKALGEIVTEESAKNPDFDKVWKNYSTFLEQQKSWTKVGFEQYLAIR